MHSRCCYVIHLSLLICIFEHATGHESANESGNSFSDDVKQRASTVGVKRFVNTSPVKTLQDVMNEIFKSDVENKLVSSANANLTRHSSLLEFKVDCTPNNITLDRINSVMLVNSTVIVDHLNATENATQNECIVVMFYYPWCEFSARAVPHFKGLARIYPQLSFLALDAYAHNSINMRFGLVGVPSVLFFHNGKVVAKFNGSDPVVDHMAVFVQKITGFQPKSEAKLLDEDFAGILSNLPEQNADYILILSIVFVILSFMYIFSHSSVYKIIVEYIRNTWREAEAQHEHID